MKTLTLKQLYNGEYKFNFFYDGTPIPKAEFLFQVPITWIYDIDEYGEYSWGYYRATKLDADTR